MLALENHILEKVIETLELYAEESRYLEMECASTGLTVAQDEAGEKARETLEELQEYMEKAND